MAAGDSRPVEDVVRNGQVDKTNRIRRRTAERNSVTLTGEFRDFPQLSAKRQGIRCKVGAQPTLPSPRRGGFT
jgi:hypothetical protein